MIYHGRDSLVARRKRNRSTDNEAQARRGQTVPREDGWKVVEKSRKKNVAPEW